MNTNAYKFPLRSTRFTSPCYLCPSRRASLLPPSLPHYFAPSYSGSQCRKRFTLPIKQWLCMYFVWKCISLVLIYLAFGCVLCVTDLRFGLSFSTTPTLQHLTQPEGAKNCGGSLSERETAGEKERKREREKGGGRDKGDEKTGTTCEEAGRPCVPFVRICARLHLVSKHLNSVWVQARAACALICKPRMRRAPLRNHVAALCTHANARMFSFAYVPPYFLPQLI